MERASGEDGVARRPARPRQDPEEAGRDERGLEQTEPEPGRQVREEVARLLGVDRRRAFGDRERHADMLARAGGRDIRVRRGGVAWSARTGDPWLPRMCSVVCRDTLSA
jgi:hypothetical protein